MAQIPFLGVETSANDTPFLGSQADTLNLDGVELKIRKGIANGYAPLDGNAKVPVANLPDTASLDAEVDGKITTHNSATTSVHGIADTAELATKTYADDAVFDHKEETTSIHGIVNTGELIQSTAIGPNTDKIVTFNESGAGANSLTLQSDKITLDNGAKLRKGTTDAGGNKGIALECTVHYELKWEAGRLYTMQSNGTTIRSVEHCMSAPTAQDDSTRGFVIGSRWVMDSGKTYVCTDNEYDEAVWQLKFSQEDGGSIDTSNGGGSIDTSGEGGSINTSGEDGGSINTSGSNNGGGGGGSINTSGFGNEYGGDINTSAGGNGAGGSINTSNGGGSINTSGYEDYIGGSLNLSAGNSGAGGFIDGKNKGGFIKFYGTGTNGNGVGLGTGGSINISAGPHSATGPTGVGNIYSSSGVGGNGGSIQLLGGAGGEEDNAGNGGNGGTIIGNGGAAITIGQNNVGESILGTGYNGGTINFSAGSVGAGGSIDISNGGGSIDTRGVGSIQLGVAGTRTTINGSASGTDKTITLPNATGTVALTNDSRFTDSRTPTSHTHGNITNAGAVGSTENLPLITTTSGVVTTGTFGTTANTFCQGNDSRLSDARTPTSHTHGNITNAGAVGTTANLPLITTTSGVVNTGSFGTTANTFCQGNDVRLGSQTIFTLGGEAKTTFALSASYLHGCMPTRGPQLSGSYTSAVLRILGNFTVTGISIHQYLPSASTVTLTYQLVRVTSASTVEALGSSVVVAGNNNLTTATSSISASLNSGDQIGLMLTLGASGTVPVATAATTIIANIYCVPR